MIIKTKNNNRTEDYVSYPLALALKKAGFDWECDHVYIRERQDKDKYEFADWTVDSRNWNKRTRPQTAISAPALSQAQKWLREEWGIHVYPTLESVNEVYYDCHIAHLRKEAFRVNQRYSSYESALSAGIAAALELIEKKGE